MDASAYGHQSKSADVGRLFFANGGIFPRKVFGVERVGWRDCHFSGAVC